MKDSEHETYQFVRTSFSAKSVNVNDIDGTHHIHLQHIVFLCLELVELAGRSSVEGVLRITVPVKVVRFEETAVVVGTPRERDGYILELYRVLCVMNLVSFGRFEA